MVLKLEIMLHKARLCELFQKHATSLKLVLFHSVKGTSLASLAWLGPAQPSWLEGLGVSVPVAFDSILLLSPPQ